jgi:hypothetical protein
LSGILLGIVVNTLKMNHIGLILLGVFVDLALGVFAESFISVDLLRDAVKDDFVLVFVGCVVGGGFVALDRSVSYLLGFLKVADVEEDPSVAERSFVSFGVRNADLVDLDRCAEEGFDDSVDLFLKVFVVKVLGFIFLNFFFGETESL